MKSNALLIVLIVVFIILYYFFGTSSICIPLLVMSLLVAAVTTIIFIRDQQCSVFRNYWIKPSNLLLLGLLIVGSQYILDIVLGYKTIGPYPLEYGNTINMCAILATVGYLAYLLGYRYGLNRLHISANNDNKSYSIKIWPIVVCQVVFLFLWIKYVDINRLFSGAEYIENVGGATSDYFEGLLSAANYAIPIIICLNNKNRVLSIKSYLLSIPLLSWICLILYLALRMVSGDRGPVIYTSLIYLYALLYITRKKIKLLYCLLLVVSASVFISVLGILRNDMTISFKEGLSSAFTSYREDGRFVGRKSFISSTEELANSFICNEIAIDEIYNKNKPHHYGSYQLAYTLNMIPYMPSFLRNTLGISTDDLASSSYITTAYLGQDPHYGLGTTCLADFFLDFDIWGIIVGFYLMGLLFTKVDLFIIGKFGINIGKAVLYFGLASKAIYISRSALLMQLQWLLIIYIMIWLLKRISTSRK